MRLAFFFRADGDTALHVHTLFDPRSPHVLLLKGFVVDSVLEASQALAPNQIDDQERLALFIQATRSIFEAQCVTDPDRYEEVDLAMTLVAGRNHARRPFDMSDLPNYEAFMRSVAVEYQTAQGHDDAMKAERYLQAYREAHIDRCFFSHELRFDRPWTFDDAWR